MKKLVIIFCIFCNFSSLFAQSDSSRKIEIGTRIKKYAGFYYVNGLTVQMQSPYSKNGSVYYGFNLGSSVLGTAISSNALSTYELELSATKFYRMEKVLQPMLRFNAGFVNVDFGEYSELFEDLPQWGIISSVETGVSICLKRIHQKMRFQLSGGFYIYSGGPGVVYPAYLLGQLNWRL